MTFIQLSTTCDNVIVNNCGPQNVDVQVQVRNVTKL